MINPLESQLDKEDIIILKAELKNVILIYLILLIVAGIFFYAGLNILFLIKALNHKWIIFSYCFIGITTYLAFLWHRIKSPLYDFLSKRKQVIIDVVQDKSIHINYGWSGNVAKDSTSQPVLKEHYIVVNNERYFLNEDDSLKLEVGDSVKLCFTSYSKRLIRVEKYEF